MKVQDLRSLSNEELNAKVLEHKKTMQSQGLERRYGRVEKPHQFKEMKKDIARIMTILKERENEN